MSYIDDIIRSTGDETATLKVVSSSNVNKWGDADESVKKKTISAAFELLSGEAQEVAEGDFESGDLRAFVPESETDIEEGNRLEYQGKTYQIDEVLKQELGRKAHYEVRASKV